jgi:mannose-6-phosphate isomerase-like protein (cupin superfamily)
VTTETVKLKSDMTLEERARIGITETLTEDGVFSFRTALLKQGITSDLRAKTDHLTITLKVYANGGENEMHSHAAEDHVFFVLAGQATFHIGTDENVKVLNAFEGVMLPKDTEYWFQSSSEGNLVMLRAGAKIPGPKAGEKDLAFLPERIEIPDLFFPDDCVKAAPAASR